MTLLIINNDYTVNYSLQDYVLVLADATQQSGGSMTMNAVMRGDMLVTPDFDGTFLVSRFDWTIDSLSAMANINGFEMDISDVVMGPPTHPKHLAQRLPTLSALAIMLSIGG